MGLCVCVANVNTFCGAAYIDTCHLHIVYYEHEQTSLYARLYLLLLKWWMENIGVCVLFIEYGDVWRTMASSLFYHSWTIEAMLSNNSAAQWICSGRRGSHLDSIG